ncbi:MAG: TrkH family potassium uptake protein [Clostridia bacterium]|nr:TrkH family potassium uptake protein [Clostridia bacterium]
MNLKFILLTVAKIVCFEGVMMLPCAALGFIYGQNSSALTYLFAALALMLVGSLGFIKKTKNETVRAREGLVIAGLGWLAVSLFGALPLVFNGAAGFLDALFEIVSGFTTTGSTILTDIESLSRADLFWRSFTHWVGGMGVLVFVMMILSLGENQSMHIMRAEVPGPQTGKLVSKMKANSRILYMIYIALTAAETVMLMFGGLDFYEALVHAFGTAGTGGFSIYNDSIGHFQSPYVQYVITAFMLIFSVNFNLYYFILIGSFREAAKSEELKWFGGVVIASVAVVTVNVLQIYHNFADAFRYASFSVASVISTTGYSTVDFAAWPVLSQAVLVFLMFIGAMSGSTGGGIKISRFAILVKSAFSSLKKQISPRSVQQVKFEGKLAEKNANGVMGYMAVYVLIFWVSLLVISADGFSFTGSFTSVAACLNNVGPGLAEVGPVGNYSGFSAVSKIVLIFDMLAGRLELFPMLALFSPSAWKK